MVLSLDDKMHVWYLYSYEVRWVYSIIDISCLQTQFKHFDRWEAEKPLCKRPHNSFEVASNITRHSVSKSESEQAVFIVVCTKLSKFKLHSDTVHLSDIYHGGTNEIYVYSHIDRILDRENVAINWLIVIWWYLTNSFFLAIHNWHGNVQHGLELDVGDSVEILEECAQWYRGTNSRKPRLMGIFPKSYIHLRDLTKSDPVVVECTQVLREWSEIWKRLYVVNRIVQCW